MQHDLSVARSIQQGLLPPKLPEANYFELEAVTTPSRAVGGDYYDIITLPGERFGITVADVSGKGLAAAILAATLQGAFAAVAAGAPRPAKPLRAPSELLFERRALPAVAPR